MMLEQLQALVLPEAGDKRYSALDQLSARFESMDLEQGEISEDGSGAGRLAFLLEDSDPQLRRKVIEIFIRYPDKVPDGHEWLENCLEDDFAQVRYAAMQYVFTIECHRDKKAASWSFLKICERFNDVDLQNRTEACRLLGLLPTVSAQELLKTLSKEKKSEAEWCSSGAFIIALEDQFMVVRSMALTSMLQLCIKCRPFAVAAVDFIVDTFNDESDDVRLQAVEALTKLCQEHQFRLQSDHVGSTLCLLDDANRPIRFASRRLLYHCLLPDDVEFLRRAIRCLHTSMLKFHKDEIAEIALALAHLGRNHPELVEHGLLHLLKIERFYLIAEPRVEDPYRIVVYSITVLMLCVDCCKMIVIFNALEKREEMVARLPAFVFKQFPYFRERFGSEVIPSFRLGGLQSRFYRHPVDTTNFTYQQNLSSIYDCFNSKLEEDNRRAACALESISLRVTDRIAASHAHLLRAILMLRSSPFDVSFLLACYWPLPKEIVDFLYGPLDGPLVCPALAQEIFQTIGKLTQPVPRTAPYRGVSKFPLRLDFAGGLSHVPEDAMAKVEAIWEDDGSVAASFNCPHRSFADKLYVRSKATESPRGIRFELLLNREGHRVILDQRKIFVHFKDLPTMNKA